MRLLPLIIVALLALPAVAAGQPVREAQSESTRALIGLVDWHEDQILSERDSQYRYLVVRDVRAATRRGLRELVRRNPQTQVLLYTNAGFMVHDRDDPRACSYWPFNGDGVDYCRASRKKEEWFLHGPDTGQPLRARRLSSTSYPASWAADIGDRGYQRQWIRNVKARLRGKGPGGTRVKVAGVFIDDLNLRPGHGLDGQISEYTDTAYGEAAVEFGERVARKLEGRGYATVANIALDPADPVERANLLRLGAGLTAINREYFVRYGSESPLFTSPATGGGPDWLTHLELFEEVQRAGGAYLAMVYGENPGSGAGSDAAQYARATFLLGWDGISRSALAYRTTDGSNPSAFGTWQTEIGRPVEPRRRVGNLQVHLRRYSDGIALVNADPANAELVVLDSTYRTRAGVCAPTVLVPAASGRVMPRC